MKGRSGIIPNAGTFPAEAAADVIAAEQANLDKKE